jgi:predicted ATP-dependent endonuclease of OLD family
MRESNWIEKLNEDNKTGEVSMSIENYRNIRKKLNFKFTRGGITIIIGKNNVGKSNILDYIYERGNEWNGLDDSAFKKSKIGNYLHKNLPLFFGNNKPIFFEKHEKILSLIKEDDSGWFFSRPAFPVEVKELNISYFYKLYYLDLKTFFNFLGSESESDEALKKIKISGCRLKYIENYDEQTLERVKNKRSLIWKEKITEREESWKIIYSGKAASIRPIGRKEGGKTITNYEGYNEGTGQTHEIDKVGSGYLKDKKLNVLIKKISSSGSSSSLDDEVYRPILLIDELEILLHPSLISDVSDFIKRLKEDDITTILTTHSPALLSKFVYDNGEKVTLVIAKSEKKEGKEDLLGELIHFWDIVKEIKEDIGKVWRSYCDCLKYWEKDHDEFYLSYWKSLLSEHALKIFFSEEILFVEGMSDYILLTSELLKRQIPELRKIEIIPIFGKSNYIFFSKLTEKLRLKFWFLLDMDKDKINEGKFPENPYYDKENISSSENKEEKKNCNSLELHTRFWYKHRGSLKNLTEVKEGEVANSGEESRISWFPENMETFLLKEGNRDKFWEGKGRHKWTKKEARIVGSISSEEFIEERFEKLKKELRKIIRLIKDQKYKENLPSAEIRRLT